jgi:superfamily II DNA or RNA helicase
MKLRPHQEQLQNEILTSISKGFRKVIAVANCGFGKTVLAASLIQIFSNKNLNVLFIVDRDNLISQSIEKFDQFNFQYGIIKSKYPENPNKNIQLASIQTLRKREWWKRKKFDVIFFDECHETAFHEISKNIIDNIFQNAIIIGLTATPSRADGQQMGDIFDKLVHGPIPAKMIEMGFTVPSSYFGLPKIDVEKCRTTKGDFRPKDLKVVCDTPEVTKAAVEQYLQRCAGKRTLVFCVDKEHAEHVAKEFRLANVPAVCVTSDTPTELRRTYYRLLRERKILAITSVDVMSKGFDEPSAEVGISLRPTMSKALKEQQEGRIQRISPDTGKTHATMLDFAGNTIRHGFITDIERYSLRHSKEKDGTELPPKKMCPGKLDNGLDCKALLYGFTMLCPHCGHVFISEEKPQISGNLERLFSDKNNRRYYRDYVKLRKTGFEKNYLPGWAAQQLRHKTGTSPFYDWHLNSIFDKADEVSVDKYYFYLKKCAEKADKNIRWIIHELDSEFGKDSWRTPLLRTPDRLRKFNERVRELDLSEKLKSQAAIKKRKEEMEKFLKEGFLEVENSFLNCQNHDIVKLRGSELKWKIVTGFLGDMYSKVLSNETGKPVPVEELCKYPITHEIDISKLEIVF